MKIVRVSAVESRRIMCLSSRLGPVAAANLLGITVAQLNSFVRDDRATPAVLARVRAWIQKPTYGGRQRWL